jgi:ATP-dependent helicase/nuclease subunit A
MSSYSDGEARIENLNSFVSLAINFESYSDRGLQGFVALLDNAVANNQDFEREKKVNDDSNSVKIMSFHGSKGLQFPVCIIADVGGEFNLMDLKERIVLSDRLGFGMKYVDDDNVLNTTVARSAVELDLRKKLIAEEIRLFYVAMTRAKERLMFSISTENVAKKIEIAAINLGLDAVNTGKIPPEAILSATSSMSWILMMLLLQKDGKKLGNIANVNNIGFNGDGRFKLVVAENVYDDSTPVCDVVKCKSSSDTADLIDNDLLQQIKDRFDFKYPFAGESTIPSKIAVTELLDKSKAGFSFTNRPQFMSKFGLTPAERGTATHEFMQYADYSNAEKDVKNIVAVLKQIGAIDD